MSTTDRGRSRGRRGRRRGAWGFFDRAVGDEGRRHHARAALRRAGQGPARRVRRARGRVDGVRAVPVLAGLPVGERSRRRYRRACDLLPVGGRGVLAIVLHAVLFAYSTALSRRAAFAVPHDPRVDIAKRMSRLPLGFFSGLRRHRPPGMALRPYRRPGPHDRDARRRYHHPVAAPSPRGCCSCGCPSSS